MTRHDIGVVQKRVQRNARKSMRAMAKDKNKSDSSMRKIVGKLGLKSVRIHMVHDIMPGKQAKKVGEGK